MDGTDSARPWTAGGLSNAVEDTSTSEASSSPGADQRGGGHGPAVDGYQDDDPGMLRVLSADAFVRPHTANAISVPTSRMLRSRSGPVAPGKVGAADGTFGADFREKCSHIPLSSPQTRTQPTLIASAVTLAPIVNMKLTDMQGSAEEKERSAADQRMRRKMSLLRHQNSLDALMEDFEVEMKGVNATMSTMRKYPVVLPSEWSTIEREAIRGRASTAGPGGAAGQRERAPPRAASATIGTKPGQQQALQDGTKPALLKMSGTLQAVDAKIEAFRHDPDSFTRVNKHTRAAKRKLKRKSSAQRIKQPPEVLQRQGSMMAPHMRASLIADVIGSVDGNKVAAALMGPEAKAAMLAAQISSRDHKTRRTMELRSSIMAEEMRKAMEIDNKVVEMQREEKRRMKAKLRKEQRSWMIVVCQAVRMQIARKRVNLNRLLMKKVKKNDGAAFVLTRAIRAYNFRKYRTRHRATINMITAAFVMRVRAWKRIRQRKASVVVISFLQSLQQANARTGGCYRLILCGQKRVLRNQHARRIQHAWRVQRMLVLAGVELMARQVSDAVRLRYRDQLVELGIEEPDDGRLAEFGGGAMSPVTAIFSAASAMERDGTDTAATGDATPPAMAMATATATATATTTATAHGVHDDAESHRAAGSADGVSPMGSPARASRSRHGMRKRGDTATSRAEALRQHSVEQAERRLAEEARRQRARRELVPIDELIFDDHDGTSKYHANHPARGLGKLDWLFVRQMIKGFLRVKRKVLVQERNRYWKETAAFEAALARDRARGFIQEGPDGEIHTPSFLLHVREARVRPRPPIMSFIMRPYELQALLDAMIAFQHQLLMFWDPAAPAILDDGSNWLDNIPTAEEFGVSAGKSVADRLGEDMAQPGEELVHVEDNADAEEKEEKD